MTLTPFLIVLFAVCLTVNLVGFRQLVHFLNVGYAFAVVGMCAVTALVWRQQLSVFAALHLAALSLWGLRLGIFVLRREARPGYGKELAAIQQQYGGVTLPAKFAIWIAVSMLYVLMFLPALYPVSGPQHISSPAAEFVQAAGLAVLAGGLWMEIVADRQKSAFKAQNPHQFCNIGLYRWVRCPNYLGEIFVWLGSWGMGIPFYTSFARWAASLAGLVCIILIMMGSTKRLEKAQDERYGGDLLYQAYIHQVPVLFPFLPIYTLKHVRVYLE